MNRHIDFDSVDQEAWSSISDNGQKRVFACRVKMTPWKKNVQTEIDLKPEIQYFLEQIWIMVFFNLKYFTFYNGLVMISDLELTLCQYGGKSSESIKEETTKKRVLELILPLGLQNVAWLGMRELSMVLFLWLRRNVSLKSKGLI